ncbi:MAG TPA: hypothetical protein ENN05_10495 [Deltaproteobacteria bacterium]|nr:hypothetical protein [Deltaproteobacteria bacterium]
MKLQDIRKMAKNMGINSGSKTTKQDLIRSIQEKEGNFTCYKTRSECHEMDCLWRDDCLPKK